LLYLHADTRPSASDDVVWAEGLGGASCLARLSFAQLQGENEAYWQAFWQRFDLEIADDPENLQGIRYCMFQLNQTYHGTKAGLNMGAKGLTGEAYNGHAFWDSETYCLPYYLFTNPDAALQLLEYRHATLPQALARAQALDCAGACYPIATVDGTECCTLWQHASLQLQPSTGVAYGVRHYCTVTGDRAFLYRQGVEMLVQICRFLASRGQWGPRTGEFGYFGVMGPDEFQMMVNNNAYTNFMARETFDYTLTVLSEMRAQAAPALAALTERLVLLPAELEAWSLMARSMRMPLDAETGIYEQHDGYFDLPHIDIQTIPRREFPLYNHWSYDRLFRNDMVKQPDVLMFLFLHNQQFSFKTKMVNYEYYEPRCIHESSLSPSLHSVLASELGKSAEAYEFFRFATRLDLDDYNRNTSEGLHITSLAAAWITIVYGFGGMRSDGPILAFRPSLPAAWRHYGFRVLYRKAVIGVSVSLAGAVFRLLEGEPVTVLIYGEETKLGSEEIVVPRSGDAAGPRPQVPAALPS
jgi:maltose phosphorylase